MSLTQDLVKELFTYRDGNLYWKHTRRGGIVAGMKAGTKTYSGYYRIRINYKMYYSHRLIFLFHHGYLPECIDHIDRDMTNNKIENLREATVAENCRNQRISKNNTTGIKGVSLNKRKNKYQVYIKCDRKNTHLGYFDTKEEATRVIKVARINIHKEFGCQGEAI